MNTVQTVQCPKEKRVQHAKETSSEYCKDWKEQDPRLATSG